MAPFWYKGGKLNMAKADLDFDTADLRLIGVMDTTTADTEKDVVTISGFTTLAEYNGSGYSRVALAGESVAYDDANDRVEIDCSDLAPWFAALGAGATPMQGFIVYRHITNDADSVPIGFIDTGGFPFNGNGGIVNLTINAEGLLHVKDA